MIERVKRRVPVLLRESLELFQRVRVNVTPQHFYSEVPNIRELKADQHWRRPFSMMGVRGTGIPAQLQFVRDATAPYQDKLASFEHSSPGHPYRLAAERNGEMGYGPTEAEFLYCFIRRFKPARIVQVGCGVSTALIQIAAAEEPGYTPQITCVEPYPTRFLREESAAGRIRLLAEPAQKTSLDVFTSLQAGDLLFIDSTHTVKVGSEVTRLMLEALPRLRPGVHVHFHDIAFPYDYQHDLMTTDIFFPRETLLLLAFLTMNDGFEISASLSMLHNAAAEELKACIPNYTPARMSDGLAVSPGHFPSAIYLKRTSTAVAD
jgi:predicted O-methyltransferase YrrM